MKMRTMQGVLCRRRAYAGLALSLVAYTLGFIVLISLCRALFADSLSVVIADATSTWVSVPDSQVDLYRMLGMQEGSMVDGLHQFRDLSDYHAVVGFIEGPLVWSAYGVGLVVIAALRIHIVALDLDSVIWALSQASTNNGSLVAPKLPEHLAQAQLELERLGERVESAFHVAEAAESRKNELVAYLAHDIKTPLTSVIGYLALLAEEPDLPFEKRERFASAALDRARRLDGMMDEFFEITRYNLGSIPVEREQVDAVMLAEQVADELLPAASGRGISIAVHAPDRPVESFIDPDKMARVLGNILKNAVAFANPSTEVLLNVHIEGESVVFAVEDAGREISPEHLVHIFEKFYRVDGARSTGRGGAGLGLAISKEIVAAHGGDITATSESGHTVFIIRIPCSCSANK